MSIDPLLDDELKRSRILKQQLQHSDRLDEVNKKTSPEGSLGGKKVKIISAEDSAANPLYKRALGHDKIP